MGVLTQAYKIYPLSDPPASEPLKGWDMDLHLLTPERNLNAQEEDGWYTRFLPEKGKLEGFGA